MSEPDAAPSASLSVILPGFNEEANVATTWERLREVDPAASSREASEEDLERLRALGYVD